MYINGNSLHTEKLRNITVQVKEFVYITIPSEDRRMGNKGD
jgi:hypothetical protein